MLQRVLLKLIRFYRKGISPFAPGVCRYTPTCSRYAVEALEAHGAWKGSWLALRRLLRCHPLGGRGYDPVPGRAQETEKGWNEGKTGVR
jgi:putative membrane protein insertion efficiency factor